MNNIFKVIWNHATQTWTAVGELASAKGKSKSIKLAAISTALLGSISGVQAATYTEAGSLISMSADLAAGTTAIPAGEQAKATGKDSIAVGKKATAGENGNVEGATAIGHGANAETNDSLAIGSGANVIMSANKALNKRSIAIGSQARVEPRPDGGVSNGAHDAIAIGTRATATAGNSVVIGRDARSKRGLVATFQSGEDTVAIGSNASADWGSSIAIGANSRTIVGNGIAIGRDATAMYKIDGLANDGEGRIFTSMALGEKATSIGGASIAAGIETKSAGVKSVAVGNKAFANGLQSIAIGDKTYSSDRSSIAMGAYAETGWNSAQRAIAIGRQAHAATTDASAFGVETFAGGVRSIASGRKAAAYGNQALAIGSDDNGRNNNGAMAIGDNAAALGTKARAIGQQTIAFGNDSVAGVTEAESNAINTAYNTYRSAYNTYSNLNKAVNSADADDYAAKTNLSTEAQNLRLLINRYAETGTIYQAENNKIQNELTAAGITFSELTTLAGKLTASGQADVRNAQPMLDNEALINKIAAIENTETGKANEHLAYLVNLAKRLQNGITKAKTAQTALSTAKTAQTAGKAAYDEAKKVFEETYGSGKSKTAAIAIGRSSVAAAQTSVALGDDAEVLSKDSTNAFAAAKNAKVDGTSPNAVVIGANAKAGLAGYSTTIDAVRRYGSADAPNATAVGSSNHVLFEKGSAFGYNNKVRGKSAGAFGVNNIVGENPVWTAKGDDAALISPKEGQSGENSFVVGSNNWVWAKNVMVLGNNVRVYGIGRRLENRENAVVLGNNSDGEPTVKKVNSANVNGMVYSGFKGNLGATKTDGSEAEKADLELQGRFVSIGAPTKKIDKTITIANGKTNTTTVTTNLITGEESTTTASDNTKDSDVAGTSTETVYGERQIKHVAAGEISSTSTDAINGSQLYAVASGLRDAFPVVYTDADGNKVVKYPDGKYYPEGTVNINGKYYPAGTTDDNVDGAKEVTPVTATNVIASMNNPSSDVANNAGGNVTLTNVAQGANTIAYDAAGNPLVKVGNSYYNKDQFENGKLKATATPTPSTNDAAATDLVKKAKTGLADLENSVASNALTVADAKNLGWVVSVGKDGKDYADKVTNANEVRFNGTDGIKVTGETKDGVRHINISLEKGAVVKQDEYTIEGKTYVSIDGKLYNKDDVDFSGNKPKPKEGKQPSNYIVKDSTVVNNTTPDNPVPVDAKVDKADHFVDGNTVYTAIQKSGWTVGKADESLTKKAFEKTDNVNKDEKVNPNDAIRFADGKGITVRTATVEETNEDGSKQTTTVVKFDTNLPIDYSVTNKNATGDTLKQAKDGNWYKEADVNADGTVKVTDGNKPTPETIVKTESGITLKNDTTTSYTPVDKTTDKNKGTGGVQLNNVGWAETPDQAVNKDQLDQTVNKSGFTVKLNDGNTTDGNKTDGSLLSTPEKVTPNDVINFKNGKGTTIKAVTKRENGVDTTTVSVDVDSSASPIVYTDGAGKELKKEGDKYYRNDDVKDAVKIGDKFYKNGTTEDDVNKGKAEEIKAVEKVIASIPGNSGNPASLKVGDGNVSSDSKEAVNGKQLHETNVLVDKNTQAINTTNTQVNKNTQAINTINNAINNQSGAFDRLERKINKQGKEARAGIAGANAAAALPQVYTAGKSMVAASAGTFKGQNALAVGYSRASDNGKVILKLQGNANTSGDIGAGVGVGYQW